MTCRELVDFLSAYLAGELTETEQRSFGAHLATCPECVRYVTSYEKTIALAKGAFGGLDDPIPSDVPEKLVRAVLAARRKP